MAEQRQCVQVRRSDVSILVLAAPPERGTAPQERRREAARLSRDAAGTKFKTQVRKDATRK